MHRKVSVCTKFQTLSRMGLDIFLCIVLNIHRKKSINLPQSHITWGVKFRQNENLTQIEYICHCLFSSGTSTIVIQPHFSVSPPQRARIINNKYSLILALCFFFFFPVHLARYRQDICHSIVTRPWENYITSLELSFSSIKLR